MKARKQVLQHIRAERHQQDEVFGSETARRGQFGSFPEYAAYKLAIAVEEVGEVARAINENERGQIYNEAIQAAAVFAALAEGVLLEGER